MPSENTYRYKVTKINLHGLDFEVKTLNNGSQINLSRLCRVPHVFVFNRETFWIDLQFEIELKLNVKIIDMSLRPFSSTFLEINMLHIIHRPNVSDEDFAIAAHTEVEELNRLVNLPH